MNRHDEAHCVRFVSKTRTFKWNNDLVFNAETGEVGPSLDVLRQAVDEGILIVLPNDQLMLGNPKRHDAVLDAKPERMRRFSVLVPESHLHELNVLVAEFLSKLGGK
jgi:hypothetical protein